jgi:starvation-inducible DNA-binding protein
MPMSHAIEAQEVLKTEADGRAAIGHALQPLLADVFTLYVKTKGYHWHVRGRQFRDFHLLLDEQAEAIFAMIDPIAERARKLGQPTLRSIGDVARHQRLLDDDASDVAATHMLAHLRADNERLAASLRELHEICSRLNDVATTSLIETWIDEAERRTWFLESILSES